MRDKGREDPGGLGLAPASPLTLCIWSPQSRDRKMVGDITGAQAFASTAKCLNIWALIFNIILTIGAIVILIIFSAAIVQAISQMKNHPGGF